jgi:hypothetical protein
VIILHLIKILLLYSLVNASQRFKSTSIRSEVEQRESEMAVGGRRR